GEGIGRIFGSLGVSVTVPGGQSMNPSAGQLLDAITAAPAGEVVVLPNNANVVAVARQAGSMSDKVVAVVPTAGIQEGFAALLDFDPDDGAGGNRERMSEAASRVVVGEVTRAVRAAVTPAGAVAEGDWLGLSREGILVVAESAVVAATGLLDRLIDERHHEMVTVFAGADATTADTEVVAQWLAAHPAGVGVEVHRGDQPLYPYLFSIE
ncbi:MAG: DAK2 domain-containing protein, partial [Acidimicrobiales bacterium]